MAQVKKYGPLFFAAAVAWILFLGAAHRWLSSAYFYAYLSLACYYWITAIITGRPNPLHIAMGADGRLSTSKFQFFVWTAVIVFVYVLLYRTLGPTHQDILSEFPKNVLLVMGFSVTTAVGAKGITVSYLNSGQITKPASTQEGGDTSLSGLVAKDDSATPDLTKVQMLIWTVIAVVVYLNTAHDVVSKIVTLPANYPPSFPDVDASLMVLMGISQGAYLGNKLVTAGSPVLNALTPSAGIPGADVTISGQSLGSSADGSVILINGQNMAVATPSWTDSAVHFTVPLKRPDGTAWHPGEQISVSMIIVGQQTTSLTFAFVAQPIILAVNPQNAGHTTAITISGRNFGTKSATSKLLLNGIDSTPLVTAWTDTQVLFTFQNVLPGGAAWQANQVITVQVAVSADFVSDPNNATNVTTV